MPIEQSAAASELQTKASFRYALVARPPALGCIPRGVSFEIEERPPEGHPHHDMARHGIFVAERELTTQELLDYELAPIVDYQDMGEHAKTVVEYRLGRHFQGYATLAEEDPMTFRGEVLRHARRSTDGVRYSICSEDHMVAAIIAALQQRLAVTA